MKYTLSVSVLIIALIAQCAPVKAVCHRGEGRREVECSASMVTKEAIAGNWYK